MSGYAFHPAAFADLACPFDELRADFGQRRSEAFRMPSVKLKFEARNPKFETNSNDQKKKSSKRSLSDVWMI
jgi:hypothetical protein